MMHTALVYFIFSDITMNTLCMKGELIEVNSTKYSNATTKMHLVFIGLFLSILLSGKDIVLMIIFQMRLLKYFLILLSKVFFLKSTINKIKLPW